MTGSWREQGFLRNKYFVRKDSVGIDHALMMLRASRKSRLDTMADMLHNFLEAHPDSVDVLVPWLLGTDRDHSKRYFVLRYDCEDGKPADPHARQALMQYAASMLEDNFVFGRELFEELTSTQPPKDADLPEPDLKFPRVVTEAELRADLSKILFDAKRGRQTIVKDPHGGTKIVIGTGDIKFQDDERPEPELGPNPMGGLDVPEDKIFLSKLKEMLCLPCLEEVNDPECIGPIRPVVARDDATDIKLATWGSDYPLTIDLCEACTKKAAKLFVEERGGLKP